MPDVPPTADSAFVGVLPGRNVGPGQCLFLGVVADLWLAVGLATVTVHAGSWIEQVQALSPSRMAHQL